ncbi:MAG: hypothetical protein SNJ33_01385 [Rikenellaceae bacterium]
MNFLLKISVAALLTLNLACSSGDSDYDDQSSSIVSFLEGSHSPTLISYQEALSSLDDDPEFYTEFINSSYRYIRDYYNSDRDNKSVVDSKSTITITFWLYDFSSYSSIDESTTVPLYTNDASLKDALIEIGLNTTYWEFEPLKIKLSDGDSIIIGAREALIGCKEGDFVEIYMTYNTAYDDTIIGVVGETTPIAMFCQIDSVE